MNILTSRELKRRGIAAVEDATRDGPARLVDGERTVGVIVTVDEYSRLLALDACADISAGKPRGTNSR